MQNIHKIWIVAANFTGGACFSLRQAPPSCQLRLRSETVLHGWQRLDGLAGFLLDPAELAGTLSWRVNAAALMPRASSGQVLARLDRCQSHGQAPRNHAVEVEPGLLRQARNQEDQ